MYAAAILLLAAVSAYAEPQYYPYQDPVGYLRSGLIASPYEPKPDSRFLGTGFGTLTLTLATTTSTSIVTVSSTCTTSTTAISTCSPSGRRRRGLALNNGKARALFYADEDEKADEMSIFLPWKAEEQPAAPAEEPKREARESPVPFIVQPGFQAPENARGARFLVSFGTSTVVTTSTSTYTVRLSALCQSSTSFSTCPGV